MGKKETGKITKRTEEKIFLFFLCHIKNCFGLSYRIHIIFFRDIFPLSSCMKWQERRCERFFSL